MNLFKGLLKILVSIVVIILLVSCSILYLIQDKLLFILIPMRNDIYQWARKTYPNSEVQLVTPDKVKLHGWLVKNTNTKKTPLLIYFGGNAGEVTGLLGEMERFKGWSVLLMNYRGYGWSEGQPSEENLFKDAVFLYDTFSQRAEIDHSKMVAWGQSLGTGVAIYLASQRPLQGVILVSPYDSIRSIAQESFPFVPVSLLLKHPFDSLTRAPFLKIPMLAVIAEEDKTVLPTHSQRLIEAWGGKTFLKVIPHTGHNNIHTGNGYWESISEFLNFLSSE